MTPKLRYFISVVPVTRVSTTFEFGGMTHKFDHDCASDCALTGEQFEAVQKILQKRVEVFMGNDAVARALAKAPGTARMQKTRARSKP